MPDIGLGDAKMLLKMPQCRLSHHAGSLLLFCVIYEQPRSAFLPPTGKPLMMEGGFAGKDVRMNRELEELAERVVEESRRQGADEAECAIHHGHEFSASVRLGEVEALKEAGSRALGVRVFLGRRAASASSSDLSWPALQEIVRGALDMARSASEDPFAGLPEKEELVPHGEADGLRIYSAGAAELQPEEGIALARDCE